MEQVKLTVRVPRDLLDGAKQYARKHDTTLTRLLSEYLRGLNAQDDPLIDAPIIRRLSGSLVSEASSEDYHRYLVEKYDNEPKSPD